MHVEEALTILDRHLTNLGGLGSPSDILLQVRPTLMLSDQLKLPLCLVACSSFPSF